MPHGHGLAVAAYFASWLIIIFFARDVIGGAYANVPAGKGFRQSLGG